MDNKKLVIGPIDSYDEFKKLFKEMFNIDWDVWSENAQQQDSEEIYGWTDGKISAGAGAYDARILVYA